MQVYELCIPREQKIIFFFKLFFYFCFHVQMFPIAVTCGNTFILKPSEKDPGDFQILCSFAIYRIVELLLITGTH
jgi:hypothetical protein